eukprot:gene9137-biopygen3104
MVMHTSPAKNDTKIGIRASRIPPSARLTTLSTSTALVVAQAYARTTPAPRLTLSPGAAHPRTSLWQARPRHARATRLSPLGLAPCRAPLISI